MATKHAKRSKAVAAEPEADEDGGGKGRSPRPIWTGSISFGLVNIPVSVVSATARRELSFTQLDKRDHGPIGYKRINKQTGAEVEWSDIVKGYEYEKGAYVVVTPEDLAAANVEATRTVAIQAFVDAHEIEPAYFETPYYLAPAGRSTRPYALLREVLRRSGKIGVATVVLRSRQHLAAVYEKNGVLVLDLMRFAHELVPPSVVKVPGTELGKLGITERELELGERLVTGMIDRWRPQQFKDVYHDDVMALIERKAKTGERAVVAAAPSARAPAGGKMLDLMTLLKQSVAAAGGEGGDAAAAGGERKPPLRRSRAERARSTARKKPARAGAHGGRSRRSS